MAAYIHASIIMSGAQVTGLHCLPARRRCRLCRRRKPDKLHGRGIRVPGAVYPTDPIIIPAESLAVALTV